MPGGFKGFRTFAAAMFLSAVSLAGVGAARREPADQEKVLVGFQRGACFGTCPVYLVSVLPDGAVAYEGRRFVKVKGLHSADLSPADLRALKQAFAEADYFTLKDAYTRRSVTDRATVTISYNDGGRSKTVVHYLGDNGAPARLKRLEADLDRILQTERWIGTAAERNELQRQHPGRQDW